MGSKTEARQRMLAASVPVVPGMTKPAASAAEIAAFGRENGFPLLLKAAAGGGGKGMRVVRGEADVPEAFQRTTSEAKSYFADDRVYAELFVEHPRHIEVQILGDATGRVIALGERECSLQRRHQKVLEECPSAAVGPDLRARMEEVAVAAGKAVDYVSAGTVEFLLAKDGRFFFLEMNTRIQVEHPVTEMVYGVDIVAEMIRIAGGRPMSVGAKPEARGHAIECRVYAEDPGLGFAPSPGRITALRWPAGPGIRVDAGLTAGDTVPLDYDPMVAKIIAWGIDREQARRRMLRALSETRIQGVQTSVPFFVSLLNDEAVIQNRISTQFLDGYAYVPPAPEEGLRDLALTAAVLEALEETRGVRPRTQAPTPPPWRTVRPSFGMRP
jgi:acetyl/propionyl-CoA carboxylase alpha subunit